MHLNRMLSLAKRGWLNGLLWPLVVLLLSTQAYGWSQEGHLVIATIAYDRLDPETKKKVDEYNSILAILPPKLKSFAFGATWLDAVKSSNDFYSTWHFINYPIERDGVKGSDISETNALWAIRTALTVIKSPKSTQMDKAFSLRVLTHVVGDIHQPLHAATLYSKKFPKGDKGGNKFRIKYAVPTKVARNLHAFWDSGCLRYNHIYKEETSQADAAIAQESRALEAKYKDLPVGADLEYAVWARESRDVAANFIYTPSMQPDTTLTQAYIETSQEMAEKQMYLAGVRLSNLLTDAFKNQPEFPFWKRMALKVILWVVSA